MTDSTTKPNQFELAGHGVHISYSTSTFTGHPQLHYRDQHHDRSFSGDEIRTLQTEIGELVTVSLTTTVDTGNTTVTLLLPEIVPDGPKTDFHTYAIHTTLHTLAASPSLVKGQHQTYQTIALKGTASTVIS